MRNLFPQLPAALRESLFQALNEIIRNFREGRWEPSELNGGKLCEVVYSILVGHTTGKMPSQPSKPRNMVAACQALENADPQRFTRSVRIQIPRMLIALYEIRNNRGVGHVGGEVDPNHMDATAVLSMSKWLVAEVVRVFHSVSTEDATKAVEAIIERTMPIIWVIDDKVRVLDPKLSMASKALLVLYHHQGWMEEAALTANVEHSNAAVFRRDVLRRCHRDKLIEYDEKGRRVLLSPTGRNHVERTIALDMTDGGKSG